MQDGPPHRTRDVFDLLQQKYNGRVIAYGYPNHAGAGLEWPPYSPDLNPCDYFLWGYVKDKVYATQIDNIEQLKAAIYSAINSIDSNTLARVISNFYKRVECCHAADDGHFEKHV
ncbi:uncharacterized protein LOC112539619 [Tetranychus urticae]|uniref:uncharacterized protein LOC112539619 n=1 Tax=Tetranychus urticae TaxID=32264 RepID=UPI000D651CFC|nr:uncharacterized protein LOC112539619 [Tetranychus urticae]